MNGSGTETHGAHKFSSYLTCLAFLPNGILPQGIRVGGKPEVVALALAFAFALAPVFETLTTRLWLVSMVDGRRRRGRD